MPAPPLSPASTPTSSATPPRPTTSPTSRAPGRALRRVEPEREDGEEQRRRGDEDARERRRDPLLREAEQEERPGHLGDGEHDEPAGAIAQRPKRAGVRGHRQQDERGQPGARERDPGGRDLVHRDGDEEVGDPPEQGDRGDEEEGASAHTC